MLSNCRNSQFKHTKIFKSISNSLFDVIRFDAACYGADHELYFTLVLWMSAHSQNMDANETQSRHIDIKEAILNRNDESVVREGIPKQQHLAWPWVG